MLRHPVAIAVLLPTLGILPAACSGITGGVISGATSGAVAGAGTGAPDWPFERDFRVLVLECGPQRITLEATPYEARLITTDQIVQLTRIYYYDKLVRYVHTASIPRSEQNPTITEKQDNYTVDWQVLLTRDDALLEKSGVPVDCQLSEESVTVPKDVQ